MRRVGHRLVNLSGSMGSDSTCGSSVSSSVWEVSESEELSSESSPELSPSAAL